MLTFWIVAAAITLLVTALLVLALLRARREDGPAEAWDLQVYRDQLKEIDRDRARGVIGEEEAERLRTEVSRRILSADAKAHESATAETGRGPRSLTAAVIAVALAGGAVALYLQLGAPGYGDLALSDRIDNAAELRANRPSQDDAEARVPPAPNPEAPEDYLRLVERLREAVADRPDDLQGYVLLARSEAALGNYAAAHEAQRRLIELKGEAATTKDYADLADMLVLAAGGFVSPEAEEVLDEVLRRDPSNGVARYYRGLMMAQNDRPDAAFRIWDRLLRESPADAPWVPPVRGQIEEMAYRAGIGDYELPQAVRPAAPGPSAGDIEAASDMTPEQRQQMVQGMVERLAGRLAEQGGTPDEWARLLGALGVLGETERAGEIWTEAQSVFAGQPEALDTVRAGARRAGVAE
ncbi:c-type cytochrome biogenesis protein CcmI [Salipiger mucosus]|uniref:Heme lyase subunit CcmH-like protein n=1 Tax=Salipiger mucosus DSM 16094 TaxID=1123237 RepID=S9QP13_9RHOB|nr:c-type cytochrome biogenesis protein CcmI [Salipiger mucosus]EPX81422.1 heme lyase subunit CcmH-like protein [Salipiger mucosus DSM 16094]